MSQPKQPNIFQLFVPYKKNIGLIMLLTVCGNGLGLSIPRLIANGIDAYANRSLNMSVFLITFFCTAVVIFGLLYLQGIVQTITSERVAFDLRQKLIQKISEQEYAVVQKWSSAKLLTNLTSDVDAVKMFVSLSVGSIISSLSLVIGASMLLWFTNAGLAAIVLLVVPVVGATFFLIFRKVRRLFRQSQEAIDRLNKVINESLMGSALIRLLNAQSFEQQKFALVNTEAKDIGMRILRLFANLIPIITLATNLAYLVILLQGGRLVILGNMSLGEFSAFTNYLTMLIFPLIILGFTSNMMAQAAASYGRICDVLQAKDEQKKGTLVAKKGGGIVFDDVSVVFGEKYALRHVSFSLAPKTKTAIIGPTAAGKTQLLYSLIGLIQPTEGVVAYDLQPLTAYDPTSLHQHIACVFQDSSLFNLTLKQNIALNAEVNPSDLEKAIETAELSDFIHTLPQQLDTVVSERGTSLSGGQKQRIMLARALALRPSVLLLDDFTARVDPQTEQRILKNIARFYPDITLISVTQKIAPVENYDKIIVLMEGEKIAEGTHTFLLNTCPEYVQIYESQQSISHYEELHPE